MNNCTTEAIVPASVSSAQEAGPRILAVKYEDCARAWDNPQFHVIRVPEHEGRFAHCPEIYAALPVAGADTLMPADHPVHSARPGATYQYALEGGGMSPLYEYVGRFTMLKRIRDDEDKQWNIIQEVTGNDHSGRVHTLALSHVEAVAASMNMTPGSLLLAGLRSEGVTA